MHLWKTWKDEIHGQRDKKQTVPNFRKNMAMLEVLEVDSNFRRSDQEPLHTDMRKGHKLFNYVYRQLDKELKEAGIDAQVTLQMFGMTLSMMSDEEFEKIIE